MPAARNRIHRIILLTSGTIVTFLVVAIPAIYLTVGWRWHNAHLEAESAIYSHDLSGIIMRNPDLWEFETVRLEAILGLPAEKAFRESRRIVNRNGVVIARSEDHPPWPVMTRSYPLLDSGVPVASLEITRSLRPLFAKGALLFLLSAVSGGGLFLLIRTYPMSALLNALELLSREKERAQVTLHSIGDGVISTGPDGRILLVNRVAERLTGWTESEARGRDLDVVFRRKGGELVARDGSRRKIEADISPISGGNGGFVGHVVVFRDVTDKVRTAEELLKSQKLESLGILAGGIAHEIRNPLSGVNISISSVEHVCAQSEGLEEEAKEKIRAITDEMKAAASKMALIVQRVLEFSKPAPPRMAMVDLNSVAESAIRLSSSTLRKRGIAVSKALAPNLPICRADPQLIEQVLVNLITNAYQALEAKDGERRLEIVSGFQDGTIFLRVADSGPGVPPALRGKIFDPFFTTRKDGTGIGLSFSQRIVADHNGTLRVDTSRWGGAEFRIEIPGVGGAATG